MVMSWGGWKSPRVARMYTEAPPGGSSCGMDKSPSHGGEGRTAGIRATRSKMATPLLSSRRGSREKSRMYRAKVHGILALGLRQRKAASENEEEPGVWRGGLLKCQA